ncbi:STAS domain-containing protein [Chloroflexota bacterium]
MIGIVLSIGWLIYVSASPHMHVLGREPGTQVFRGVDDHPDYETYPGLLVLRFDAGLFFASADALADRLIELYHQADPRLQTIVLDFEGVNFVDSQGSDTLAEIIELATSRDIELRLARVKTEVKEMLHRDGIIDRLGESRIYGNVYEAAADQIPEAPLPPAVSS